MSDFTSESNVLELQSDNLSVTLFVRGRHFVLLFVSIFFFGMVCTIIVFIYGYSSIFIFYSCKNHDYFELMYYHSIYLSIAEISVHSYTV